MTTTRTTSADIARDIDVYAPDTEQGQNFLVDIDEEAREILTEHIASNGTADDAARCDIAWQVADEAVTRLESRGTHGKWLVLVDLGAYRENVEEPTVSLNALGDRVLYDIAYRVAMRALFED